MGTQVPVATERTGVGLAVQAVDMQARGPSNSTPGQILHETQACAPALSGLVDSRQTPGTGRVAVITRLDEGGEAYS